MILNSFFSFLETHGPILDEVLYLQRYSEGWEDGKWEEKHDFRECVEAHRYRREDGEENYRGESRDE